MENKKNRLTAATDQAGKKYSLLRCYHKEAETSMDIQREITELMVHVPYGRKNAVSRRALCTIIGCGDRTMRKRIEQARRHGFHILNDQDHGGYFISDDPEELARYYRQERSRALATLTSLKTIRQRLKAGGYPI